MSAAPKYKVCSVCEGEGFVGTLGAYTSDEFAEAFEDVDEYRELHEASKEPCPCCKGKRVSTSKDRKRYRDQLQWEAEARAEQRYAGCY